MRYERKGFSAVESAMGKELYQEDPDFPRCLTAAAVTCTCRGMVPDHPPGGEHLRCLVSLECGAPGRVEVNGPSRGELLDLRVAASRKHRGGVDDLHETLLERAAAFHQAILDLTPPPIQFGCCRLHFRQPPPSSELLPPPCGSSSCPGRCHQCGGAFG